VALQRYFTTTSLSAARKSFIVNIFSSLCIGMLLALSGLALRYFYLAHVERLPAGLTPASGADELMPFFFAYQLPAGLGGLILVSFLCDAMQTLGSGVNSIAAVITADVASREGGAAAAGNMRSARLVTLGVGAVATVLAVLAAAFAMHSGKTIFDMLPRMFNMFLGPLACMFLMGMFFPRATSGVVLAAAMLTQVFSSAWSWWGEVPVLLNAVGLSGWAETWGTILGVDAAGKLKTPSIMLAVAVPAVVGLGGGWLLSRLFGRADHPGTAYTWRAVMQRPIPAETRP
jgi:SSS family solute:Na+ symporter